jgi:hypothetical protein
MKSNPAKLPRVAQNQRLTSLSQDQMVVLPGLKIGLLNSQVATHAKVDPKPALTRKDKEHLFSAGHRSKKFLPDESPSDLCRIGAAKDPLLAMELHRDDLLAEAHVPASTSIFDLG